MYETSLDRLKQTAEKMMGSKFYERLNLALEEVALGCSGDPVFQQQVEKAEALAGRRVLAVVLTAKEHNIYIYPKIHASDDMTALEQADIYHEAFQNGQFVSSGVVYDVNVDTFMLMLYYAIKPGETPLDDWEIFFTCNDLIKS